ncbi:hypothetical protein [Joostella sp. CR20]|uniref:hypothetical protein n=1 Tax=Joostella sp. CR20 TaxID=2804312 RepID=UPI00313C0479
MAKKRVQLSDDEAQELGFNVKQTYSNGKTPQYSLTDEEVDKLNNFRNGVKVKTSTKANDYNQKKLFILSAWSNDGRMMDIDEYCEHYKLPRQSISSYKLVSHTGTPFYNIVFKEQYDDDFDFERIKNVLNRELNKEYKYTQKHYSNPKECALKWADLHFGAHVYNLVHTPDYNSDILLDSLLRSVDEVNYLKFKKTHVHIHGDLIESFSGLNHINSWLSLNKDETGANAIKLCVQLLHKALSKIDNLGKIKIVAGNHDRISKANDEDVKGGAADLIAWGLELLGYDVEFHPFVIIHKIENINHIILHGDKAVSKRPTKDILWNYGEKGYFNLICEAHLHSLMESLSISQKNNYKVIKDDSIDHRRIVLAPFFTGNYYSETLDYFTNAGFSIIWENWRGKPQVLNASV